MKTKLLVPRIAKPTFLMLLLPVLFAGRGFAQEPKPGATVVPPKAVITAKPAASAAPASATLTPGSVAPDFMSEDVAGKKVNLSNWKGKVIVLDFWATWCGPCMRSLPHTQEVAHRYKDQGVVVLASCTSDTRAKFTEWVKANQAKYSDIAFTCDPNERGSATYDERASMKLYGVRGIPTQFIIGRDGKIVAVLVGYSPGDVRCEAALAKAGVKVDPATQSQGEEQLKRGG